MDGQKIQEWTEVVSLCYTARIHFARGEPMEHVLVFDPGVTTGAALFCDAVLLSVGAITDWKTIDRLLFGLPNGSVVVCETFTSYKIFSDGQHTLQTIGVIRYLTRKYTQEECLLVRPQVKMAWKKAAEKLLQTNRQIGVRYQQHHYDAVGLGMHYYATHHPELAVTAYKVADLLSVEEYSPSDDRIETRPIHAIARKHSDIDTRHG